MYKFRNIFNVKAFSLRLLNFLLNKDFDTTIVHGDSE